MSLAKKDKMAFQKVFNNAVGIESASKHLLNIQGKGKRSTKYMPKISNKSVFFFFCTINLVLCLVKVNQIPVNDLLTRTTKRKQRKVKRKRRERGRKRESKKKKESDN